jgi:PAS domain S-box-containing protein
VLPLEGGFLRQLFEESPDAMVLVDNGDRVLEISRGFTRLFGFKAADARGKLINELVASGDLAEDASSISGKVLAGEAVHRETLRLAKDKRAIPVSVIAYPIQYGNRQIGVVAIYRDISAQKEAREQFREFLQNVGAIAVILDTRSRIVFANKFFLGMVGLTGQDAIGRDFFDLCVPEETRETMRHVFESLLSTGGSSEGTNDLLTPSGLQRISWSNSVLRDLYGRVSGVASLGLDITSQVASRQALERRQRILEAVSFSADRFLRTGSWKEEIPPVLEKLGRAAEADRAWICASSAAGRDARMEFEWFLDGEACSPDPGSRMNIASLATALARKEIVAGRTEEMPSEIRDSMLDRGTGSLIIVPVFLGGSWWGCIGFEDPSGDRIWSEEEKGALRAAADILGAAIQRREFEKQLRGNMAQYAALIDNLSAGVLAESTDRTILYANAAFCCIFGIPSPAHVIGRSLQEASEAFGGLFADPGAFSGATARCIDGGIQVQSQELVMGGGTILERDYVPISMGSENYGHLWLYRDVTEQRRTEGIALRAQKLESLGALAGGIAHDFNNLLTGILGNVSLARMAMDDPDEISRRLEDAEKAAFRARALTHQLLTFSRGGEPVKRLIDLRSTIRDTAEFVLSGGRCRCEYRISRDLWRVEADEGLLAQVMTNMVMNASQAMPDGGRIVIAASNLDLVSETPPVPAGRYVHITVADEGPGIPAENLERIFDPYFSTRPEGLGLGLAACYSIISRHGGHVIAESEPEGGAVFHIYLAASPPAEDDPGEEAGTADVTGCGRILVVDDDEMILSVSTGILATLGYRSETATDCTEAREKFRSALASGCPFAAVILDLTMPAGPCGVETLAQLRAIDPGIPAIVSSGYSNSTVLSNPAEYGFDGVVSKPYRVEDLGMVLGQVLQAGGHLEPRTGGVQG